MKRFLVPALIVAFSVCTAKAGSIGSLAFFDNGTSTVNTGDVNTATIFTFGDLITSQNESGFFAGPPALPNQDFGSQSFSLVGGGKPGFSISSTAFGSFQSTSISELINSPGIVEISISGRYTAGTFDPSIGTTTASFTVTFIQDPAHTGIIVGSGVFVVPTADPPGVPEPATLVMGLTGIVGGCLFYFLRRRSTKATA
jgi:hypothetical protein